MSAAQTRKKAAKFKKSLKKLNYQLPEFDLEKLFAHIQKCVDAAPYGLITLVVDLFCGAGGVSEGIEQAKDRFGNKSYVVIAGINHDKKAIYSQAVNHPLAYYTTEDIRVANLDYIVMLVEACRKRFPQCKIAVWGSLECTNHSNAKGGMSRDGDSRTLAWHLFRYIEAIDPDGIWIENVKEFYDWGPTIEKVVMKKGEKSVTIFEKLPNEIEYYQQQINDGWILSCPLDKKKPKKGETLKAPRPVFIPIKSLKGTYYRPWRDKVKRYGYQCQEWFLDAADFGVPQHRKRFFPMFQKVGQKITKPVQTHAEDISLPQFAKCKQHIPIKTCLDFSEEGESIFTPGKITSPKSFERYYNGCIKFVAGGKDNFIAQRNSGAPLSKVYFTDQPSRTITTSGGNQQLVQMEYFITKYGSDDKNGANPGHSIEEPSRTITTMNHFGLIQAEYFIAQHNGVPKGDANPGSSIDKPAPTLTCKTTSRLVEAEYFITNNFSSHNNTKVNDGSDIESPSRTVTTWGGGNLVKAQFLDVVYGNGTPYSINRASPTIRTKDGLSLIDPKFFIANYQGQSDANSIDEVSPTLMTKEKLALVDIEYFIVNSFSGGGQNNSVNDPSAAVTTNHKSRVVNVEPFIASSHFSNEGSSIHDPSPVITANRKHHVIINPSHGGNPHSVNVPSPTVVASQGKAPLCIISTEEGWFGIPVYKTDFPIVVKLKEFMALYGICDIKMRMLMVSELLKIQSFPENYYLAAGQTEQKKFIGNAVPVLLARKIAESMHDGWLDEIINNEQKRA